MDLNSGKINSPDTTASSRTEWLWRIWNKVDIHED